MKFSGIRRDFMSPNFERITISFTLSAEITFFVPNFPSIPATWAEGRPPTSKSPAV